jgi:uncharacterized protein (DUF1778 family)
MPRYCPVVVLIVAGIRLQREQVLSLASMLASDESTRTARILLEAVTNRQQFVALTVDDKERMLAVLDHPPEGLADLRCSLFDELNWKRRGLVPPLRAPRIDGERAQRERAGPNVAWV